jgi:hypothetical protein
MADGIRSLFGRAGALVAGLFRGDEEEAELQRQRQEEDRLLGRPRLPRARDRTPSDPGEPLGVPLDSIPGWGEVPVDPQDPQEPEEPEEPEEGEVEIETEEEEPPDPAPGDAIILLRPASPDG